MPTNTGLRRVTRFFFPSFDGASRFVARALGVYEIRYAFDIKTLAFCCSPPPSPQSRT